MTNYKPTAEPRRYTHLRTTQQTNGRGEARARLLPWFFLTFPFLHPKMAFLAFLAPFFLLAGA